jgi:hypothetical protein
MIIKARTLKTKVRMKSLEPASSSEVLFVCVFAMETENKKPG